jgi:hypothetical protein
MKITPELQMRFREYVQDVPKARENLEFIWESLGTRLALDRSRESLEVLEAEFWRAKGKGIPAELTDESQIVRLMGQYLADCIVQKTGAKWVQSTDPNPMFGQPALDGFGNQKWDRIYPVALANNFVTLQKTNPSFPGIAEQNVLMQVFDKAVRLHSAKAQS